MLALLRQRFDDLVEKMPVGRKLLKRLGLDVLFVVIWGLTIVLLMVEVYSNSLKDRMGFVMAFEVVIDVFATIDIARRCLKARTCSEYLTNPWNWIDLFTAWLVMVHWIVFAVEPVFQIISDAWLVIRYSVLVIRLGFWTVQGRHHYEKYHLVANDDVDIDELLPNAMMLAGDSGDDLDIEMTPMDNISSSLGSHASSSALGSTAPNNISGVGMDHRASAAARNKQQMQHDELDEDDLDDGAAQGGGG
mmetsp:Transcript_25806/g.50272  ORF Transcript_25806/g.50272 Transcript_25806/m.50272 type:complete len:248 (+) Transcript_25806:186-929(+)